MMDCAIIKHTLVTDTTAYMPAVDVSNRVGGCFHFFGEKDFGLPLLQARLS